MSSSYRSITLLPNLTFSKYTYYSFIYRLCVCLVVRQKYFCVAITNETFSEFTHNNIPNPMRIDLLATIVYKYKYTVLLGMHIVYNLHQNNQFLKKKNLFKGKTYTYVHGASFDTRNFCFSNFVHLYTCLKLRHKLASVCFMCIAYARHPKKSTLSNAFISYT